jgi:dihydroflavonol-4-reductase
MTNPAAKGERFLAISGDHMTVKEMATVLKTRMGDAARRVPTRQVPDLLIRLAALFDSTIAQSVPEMGKRKHATGEKARRLIGWAPRPPGDALVATAESLLRLGLLRKG